jgi:biopolymer transport protein ExbB
LTQQIQGPQGELVRIAIAAETNEARDDRLHGTLLQQRIRLERWLSAIALTASISPLLGLLGTVSGMITTFQAMALFGAGDTSAVSGGVGEALINTELGLVVAIPALLAHALLSRKAKGYLAQLESDAVNLSRLPLRTGAA